MLGEAQYKGGAGGVRARGKDERDSLQVYLKMIPQDLYSQVKHALVKIQFNSLITYVSI